MFVDLPKQPRIKTDGNSSKSDVNRARWTTEEVMYYYGEWIRNEKVAALIMEDIGRRIEGFYKIAFTHRMNMVRDYLMYECGIKDIPFIPNYRRVRDD